MVSLPPIHVHSLGAVVCAPAGIVIAKRTTREQQKNARTDVRSPPIAEHELRQKSFIVCFIVQFLTEHRWSAFAPRFETKLGVLESASVDVPSAIASQDQVKWPQGRSRSGTHKSMKGCRKDCHLRCLKEASKKASVGRYSLLRRSRGRESPCVSQIWTANPFHLGGLPFAVIFPRSLHPSRP